MARLLDHDGGRYALLCNYMFVLILFFGGVLSGLYGSTVGGSGLVSFPLVLLTGLPIHSAIATNRFGATLLELTSAARFTKEHASQYKVGIFFGLVAALGALIGSSVVVAFDAKYLTLINAIMLAAVLIVLLSENSLGMKERRIPEQRWVIAAPIALLLGIYGGFFGIGFGTFITFVFLIVGLDFVKSAAASRIVGLLMSLTATVVFAFHGLIHYPSAIALGLGLAIGGWIGVGMGIKKGNAFIRGLFILMVLVSIAKLLFDFFAQT
ncbi:MAG: sulfite exporter TauE/SafE family protein [Candidatus Peregrinibacteria bacterium]